MQTPARFFDGETGRPDAVDVRLDRNAGHISFTTADGTDIKWNMSDLRALDQNARDDRLTLTTKATHSDDSGLIETARLILSDPDAIVYLQSSCPDLYKKDVASGTARKIVTRTGLAVGAVALMMFVIIPNLAGTLAPFIPIEREIAWGKSITSQMARLFGGKTLSELTCSNPSGRAALDKMVARLTDAGDLEYTLNVQVFDHEMVNAFAAPGGQIVFMRGLIERAETPEEVAAVLGHEIGHVERRDVTRNALRAAGSAGVLSMVIGDFAGGTVAVAVTETLINSSYSRTAETAADEYAHDLLDAANVSLTGMAAFFDSLKALEADMIPFSIPEYFSSHPDTNKRADLARHFAQGQSITRPVLTDSEWADLRAICD